jgi:hypothetical protein
LTKFLGRTIKKSEVKKILALWKLIKTQILQLKNDFWFSCRLLRKLSRETYEFYAKELPKWLKRVFDKWFRKLQGKICDKTS